MKDTLKSLNFTETESRVYLALLKLGGATAKDIANEARIPVNKLYAILERLKRKEYIALLPVTPKKYALINPKSVLTEKLKEKKKELNQIEKEVNNLIKLSKQNTPIQKSFLVLKGQKQIMKKLIEETFNAKKEILSCHTSWKIHKNSLYSIKNALNRKVEIRMLGVINNTSHNATWERLGVKTKGLKPEFTHNPLRFTVFDEKKVRITIGNPEIKNKEDYLTFWIESISFAKTMKKVFEDLWDNS